MQPLSRRRFLGLGLGGAAGAVLAGCGADAPAGTGPSTGLTGTTAGGKTTITTAVYAKNHASSPLFWQRFAPAGITVEVKPVASAAEVQQGLEAGQLDFGLMGVYNTNIAAVTTGINSKIVGMIAREGIGLIGSVERGVASVADLEGRRVGVPPPGVQVLILNYLLEQTGLKLGRDVEGIPVEYADHPTALARGDVDAYIGTEPLCTQSVVTGVGQRLSEVYDTPIGDLNTAMWASPAMLEQPDLCRAATLMQKQAAEYLTPGGTNDKEVWQELLVTQFGYTEEIYAAVLDNVGAEWRFGEERVAQFEGAGRVLVDQGAIGEQPDYESLYAREYWDV